MAHLVCRRCGTTYPIGASFCPQCTAESAYIEQEDVMPHSRVADDYPENQEVDVAEVPVDETVIADVPADEPVEVDDKPAPKKSTRK